MPTRADLSTGAEHKDEHTPLMIAALEGDSEAVKTLLACGGRINAKDHDGHTALMFAVINSHTEIVKTLLRAGARVNARAHGYTGIKRWLLGSVAQSVVSHAPCSVEVVRQKRTEES